MCSVKALWQQVLAPGTLPRVREAKSPNVRLVIGPQEEEEDDDEEEEEEGPPSIQNVSKTLQIINPQGMESKADPFIRRCSVMAVVPNHLSYKYPLICWTWHSPFGMLQTVSSGVSLKAHLKP